MYSNPNNNWRENQTRPTNDETSKGYDRHTVRKAEFPPICMDAWMPDFAQPHFIPSFDLLSL